MEEVRRNEKVNPLSLYLRMLKRLWLMIPSAVCGAAAAGIIYMLVTEVTHVPLYEAGATLYLHFAADDLGETLDNYNAYTWNMLLATDDIAGTASSYLMNDAFLSDNLGPEEREAVAQAKESGTHTFSSAETEEVSELTLPSDLRVMYASCRDADARIASAYLKSLTAALVNYGEIRDEFTSIELLSVKAPERVRYTDRLAAAVISGGIAGVIICFFIIWLYGILDDAVYTPEQARERYALPVIGILPAKAERYVSGESVSYPGRLKEEMIAFLDKLSAENGSLSVVAVAGADGERDRKKAARAASDIRSLLPEYDFGRLHVSADEHDAPVLLAVPFGKRLGTITEHTIAQLSDRGEKVVGILLTDTDMRFIKRYYRI